MSDARDKILARRAKFVAAALAGVSIASSEACKPQPCLEVAPQPPDAAPGPCLSQPWVPPSDAGVEDASVPNLPEPRDAAMHDAASTSKADGGVVHAAPADAGGDGETKIVLPPPTRQVPPPVAPPRPCLLLPIEKKR